MHIYFYGIVKEDEDSTVLSDVTNQVNDDPSHQPPLSDSGSAATTGVVVEKHHVDPTKLKITYEQYRRLTNILVIHMRENEERNAENEDWEGVKQSELIEW